MAEQSLLEQAQAAAKSREYARALELYDQVVAADETAVALAGRAAAHNKLENYMEAAADASRAIELDSKLAAAHKERGTACYNLDEFESAMEAFEAASALEPTKNIHKSWVNMCKVQLGEELPQPPVLRLDPTAEQPGALAPAQAADALSDGAAGSSGGSGKGVTLTGDALKAFLAKAGGMRNLQPPPEPEEEPGTEKPKAATADDPEFSKYWKAPVAASVAASIAGKPEGVKYRHQWFQSGDWVEVNVLAKGLKKEQVAVTFKPRRLRVATTDAQGQEDYTLDLALHGEVVPGQSRYEVLGTKVEVKLRKGEAQQWPALEQGQPRADAVAAPAQQLAAPAAAGQPVAAAPAAATPAYPYAGKKVDWDKFAHDLQKEEKEEKLEGDAALMKFFKELYDGGDEDTRRAMVKSMQESGGTALSMNWKEVGKQDYSKRGEKDDGGDKDW